MSEIFDEYYDKFGEGLPTWGLDKESHQLMLQLAKEAIAGKRGIVTYKDLGINPENDILIGIAWILVGRTMGLLSHISWDLEEFRKKPTKAGAELVFVECEELGVPCPKDVVEFLIKGMNKIPPKLSDKDLMLLRLKRDLERRAKDVTREDVFKEYAVKYDSKGTDRNEPWEILEYKFKNKYYRKRLFKQGVK